MRNSMKIKDTLIVINSSNRIEKVVTHALFPHEVIDWIVAVPDEQAIHYESKFPDNTFAMPDHVAQFLPSQRQYIMEEFGDQYKYIWLMDDDLTFFKRNEELKLKKCTQDDITKMFYSMRSNLEEVPMVGISTRLGNNRIETDHQDICRVTRCYGINTEVFREVQAIFNPFEPFVAEDFHMALSFLNAGYKTRALFTFAQEDIGSNAEGGCSLYRTAEVQKKTSFWMADNHPEVDIRVKSSKNWKMKGKGAANTRVDMVVGWRKAYKPKKVRATGGFNSLFNKGR